MSITQNNQLSKVIKVKISVKIITTFIIKVTTKVMINAINNLSIVIKGNIIKIFEYGRCDTNFLLIGRHKEIFHTPLGYYNS